MTDVQLLSEIRDSVSLLLRRSGLLRYFSE